MTLIWPGIGFHDGGLHEVWLGGQEAANSQSMLRDNNIKTLVCCNPPLPYWRIVGVEYMVFDSNQVTEGSLHMLDEGQNVCEIERRLALSCPGAAEHSCSIRFAITRLSSDSVHDCPRFGL